MAEKRLPTGSPKSIQTDQQDSKSTKKREEAIQSPAQKYPGSPRACGPRDDDAGKASVRLGSRHKPWFVAGASFQFMGTGDSR